MHKSVWMLLVRSVDERALSYSTLGGSQRGNNRKGRENEESGRYFAGAFVYIFSLSLSLQSQVISSSLFVSLSLTYTHTYIQHRQRLSFLPRLSRERCAA